MCKHREAICSTWFAQGPGAAEILVQGERVLYHNLGL
jgi:hypothetical protein